MSNIKKYDEVDINSINYSKPEKVGKSYFGSLSYGEKLSPFYIQTPKLVCKTNLSEMKDKKAPYLEVEIPNGKFDFYDLFLSLDDENIKKTVQKSKEWFDKELPLEAIDDMYRRSTKPLKKNTNPIMKFRLPSIKNEIKCGIYNQKRVFIGLDEVKEDSEIILILHIRGLKILKTYYYCDCYISQVKVFLSTEGMYNIINEYAIEDDEIKVEDNDILDEVIISEMRKEKESEIKKTEDKKKIEETIYKLQLELNSM